MDLNGDISWLFGELRPEEKADIKDAKKLDIYEHLREQDKITYALRRRIMSNQPADLEAHGIPVDMRSAARDPASGQTWWKNYREAIAIGKFLARKEMEQQSKLQDFAVALDGKVVLSGKLALTGKLSGSQERAGSSVQVSLSGLPVERTTPDLASALAPSLIGCAARDPMKEIIRNGRRGLAWLPLDVNSRDWMVLKTLMPKDTSIGYGWVAVRALATAPRFVAVYAEGDDYNVMNITHGSDLNVVVNDMVNWLDTTGRECLDSAAFKRNAARKPAMKQVSYLVTRGWRTPSNIIEAWLMRLLEEADKIKRCVNANAPVAQGISLGPW